MARLLSLPPLFILHRFGSPRQTILLQNKSSAASKTSEVPEKSSQMPLKPGRTMFGGQWGGGGSVGVVSSSGVKKEGRALARLWRKHLSWRFCLSAKNKHRADLQRRIYYFRPEKHGTHLCKQECGFSARGSATPL